MHDHPFRSPTIGSRPSKGRAVKAFKVARRSALSLFALISLLGSGAARSEELRPPFSSEQRQAIGQVVKEYLLQNPEVLRDASIELERKTEQLQKTNQVKALEQYRSSSFPPAAALSSETRPAASI